MNNYKMLQKKNMIGLKDEEWNMKKKLEEVVEKSNEQNKRTRKLRMEYIQTLRLNEMQ